jgi:hypothetical protein
MERETNVRAEPLDLGLDWLKGSVFVLKFLKWPA